jgi:hypothetical protein
VACIDQERGCGPYDASLLNVILLLYMTSTPSFSFNAVVCKVVAALSPFLLAHDAQSNRDGASMVNQQSRKH